MHSFRFCSNIVLRTRRLPLVQQPCRYFCNEIHSHQSLFDYMDRLSPHQRLKLVNDLNRQQRMNLQMHPPYNQKDTPQDDGEEPISTDETKNIEGDARHLFEDIDINQDGVLSKREFMRWYVLREEEASRVLTDMQQKETEGKEILDDVTDVQYRQYILRIGIPFLAFGAMDNSLMIFCGEMIDATLSHKFGLSMMFSAALGNVIADVTGVGFGDAVERFLSKWGLKDPHLNFRQLMLPRIRRGRTYASLIGISVGCVIGMAPLIFF